MNITFLSGGSVEYKILDVDHYEGDAILSIGTERFYFQFNEKEGPTLDAALQFLRSELTRGL